MDCFELLTVYERVAVITGDMLDAARARDWELLENLESACSAEVKTLRTHERPTELPKELREKKIFILKKILADDKEIRNITEPWMQELSQLMKTSSTNLKLSQSYGANQIG